MPDEAQRVESNRRDDYSEFEFMASAKGYVMARRILGKRSRGIPFVQSVEEWMKHEPA